MFRATLGFVIVGIVFVNAASGGLRIDLRPEGRTVIPGDPPMAVAEVGELVNVDVWLVDTGNPQGNISLRSTFLDFMLSDPGFLYPGPDGMMGTPDDNNFAFENPNGIGAVFPNLPLPSWVYPLPTPHPEFQITVPDDGEVRVGEINIIIPGSFPPAMLDAIHFGVADPSFGARVDFGFGTPGDPVTTWRAFTGEITGGQLLFVPEPTSLVLLLAGCGVVVRRKRACGDRSWCARVGSPSP